MTHQRPVVIAGTDGETTLDFEWKMIRRLSLAAGEVWLAPKYGADVMAWSFWDRDAMASQLVFSRQVSEPVVEHLGCRVYRAMKQGSALRYWYSFRPGDDVELSDAAFDVRDIIDALGGQSVPDWRNHAAVLVEAIDRRIPPFDRAGSG